MPERIIGVVVTHRRRELLASSLKVLTTQTRPLDHLVVVDNADESDVRALVDDCSIPTTYIGSAHNLGGAGGFALGMLLALSLGADRVWLADDDGRPEGPEVLSTLLDCAIRHNWRKYLPSCATSPNLTSWPSRYAVGSNGVDDVASWVKVIFSRESRPSSTVRCSPRKRSRPLAFPICGSSSVGDEVEVHRRLIRSGLRFGTCLQTAYLHPDGADEFKPILGGRMHTQYPDNETKRFYTYRNRGYLLSQPGMRRLLPQEWVRFGWYFLITRRDVSGLREWMRLRKLGRSERFSRI